MFNFDNKFFEINQKKLLYIANSKWLGWLLGLNRLPKELKGKKIDKITPNSIHHKIGKAIKINGKWKYQEQFKAEFFVGPKFAEALAYNLSPFCYFQELKNKNFSWRFSPAGLAYVLLLGLLGKLAGLPFAFIGTTTSYYAAANNDTVYEYEGNKCVAENEHFVGNTGYVSNLGMRFTNITIAKSATISNAVVYLYATRTRSTSVSTKVYGEDIDDAPTFVPSVADFDGRTRTTANVTYNTGSWTASNWYNTPDIKTVIQEIVDRAGWASGNDLVIFIEDNGSGDYQASLSYAGGHAAGHDPYLSVTYTTSTAWTQDLSTTIALTDSVKKTAGKGLSQTTTLSDAMSKASQKGITDNSALADSMGKQATIIRSDTISLTDSIIKNFTKILTQTAISLADILKRDDQKGLSETIAVADAVKKDNQAQLSDTINLSDVVASDPRIVIAEILSLTDRLPVLTINKFLTDSNALTDQIGERQAGKGVSDSVALTDAQRFDGQKAIIDNLALSDALTSIAAFTKSLAESLAVSDNLTPQAAYQRAVSENIAVVDDIVAQIIISLALSENLAMSDVLSFTAQKQLADTATLADVIDSVKQFFISIADNPAASEQLINQIEKIISDQTNIADALITANGIMRSVAEAVALSEAIKFGIQTEVAEIVTLADSIRKTTGKNIGESILVVEVLTAQNSSFLNLSDNITLSDIITPQTTINISILDNLQVAELLIKEYNKNILEAIAIADSIVTLQKERAYKKTIVVSQKKDKIVLLTNTQ